MPRSLNALHGTERRNSYFDGIALGQFREGLKEIPSARRLGVSAAVVSMLDDFQERLLADRAKNTWLGHTSTIDSASLACCARVAPTAFR